MAKFRTSTLSVPEAINPSNSCYQIAWQQGHWANIKAADGHVCHECRTRADSQQLVDRMNTDIGYGPNQRGKN
jgi:hypothetical protein